MGNDIEMSGLLFYAVFCHSQSAKRADSCRIFRNISHLLDNMSETSEIENQLWQVIGKSLQVNFNVDVPDKIQAIVKILGEQ
jgi:hypothetical protein